MNSLQTSAPDPRELPRRVAILKDEAKLFRDKGNYAAAINQLKNAISLIQRSGWEQAPSDTKREIAFHLADCWGMLGGNFRRAGKLEDAIKCFGYGKRYEEDPQYRLASSYNLVNAIIAPIEAGEKNAFSQKRELSPTIREDLSHAIDALTRQISDPAMGESSRRMDRWAWADLGQCQVLLGHLNEARDAYRRFIELSDAASVRSSCQVLEGLRTALETRGNHAGANGITEIIQFLQSGGQNG